MRARKTRLGHQSLPPKKSTGRSGGGLRGYDTKPAARRPSSDCFIVSACAEARGLPDDCYELSLLRMFRREHVAKLPEGPQVLEEYEAKAPRVVEAIGALHPALAREVYADLYDRGVKPGVRLITNGRFDAAYALYRELCAELEELYLHPGTAPGAPVDPGLCPIAAACLAAQGLPADCYEVELLASLRRHAARKEPAARAALAAHLERAPRVMAAIEARGVAAARAAYRRLYKDQLVPTLLAYMSGCRDAAYAQHLGMYADLEETYLPHAPRPTASAGKENDTLV